MRRDALGAGILLRALVVAWLGVTAGACVTIDGQPAVVFPGGPASQRRVADAATQAIARRDYATAERILGRALQDRGGGLQPGDAEGVALLVLSAETHIHAGRFADAESAITRALVLAQPIGPLGEHGSQRSAHFRLGEAYEAAGRDAEAEEHYYKALQICQTDPDYEARAECNEERAALVRVFVAGGRYRDAEPLVLKSIAATQTALGAHDLRLAYALGEAADFYSRQGKYSLGEPLFARGLSVWTNVHGEAIEAHNAAVTANAASPFEPEFLQPRPEHCPFTAPAGLDSQPLTLLKLNNRDKSVQADARERELWALDSFCERTALAELDAIAARGGENSLDFMIALQTVGYVYFKQGRHSRATGYFDRALAGMRHHWPELDVLGKRRLAPWYVATFNALGVIARSEGRYRDAIHAYERAMEVASRNFDARDGRYLDTVMALATVYREMGDLQAAEGFARRYMNQVRAARGTGHTDYAWALRNLAYVSFLRNDVGASKKFEAEALAVWGREEPVLPDF